MKTKRLFKCLMLASIIPFSTIMIANDDLQGNRTVTGKNIYIGSDVTRSKPEGPVVIESGNTTFDATNTVIIKNGFECKKGAILEIK